MENLVKQLATTIKTLQYTDKRTIQVITTGREREILRQIRNMESLSIDDLQSKLKDMQNLSVMEDEQRKETEKAEIRGKLGGTSGERETAKVKNCQS